MVFRVLLFTDHSGCKGYSWPGEPWYGILAQTFFTNIFSFPSHLPQLILEFDTLSILELGAWKEEIEG